MEPFEYLQLALRLIAICAFVGGLTLLLFTISLLTYIGI